MKENRKQTFAMIFSLLIIIAICIVLFWGIKYAAIYVFSFDKEIVVAIIVTSGTILISVITVVYSQNRSKKRDIIESHRPKKIEAYKTFMDLIIKSLRQSKNDEYLLHKGILNEDIENLFFQFQSDLIVWGAPKVIKAFHKFKAMKDPAQILFYVDDVLQEIRNDLGNSNKNLVRGDLVKLLLSDPETLDKMISEKNI